LIGGVPAARPGESALAECFLGEQHAGREVHQHVNLAAVQRILGGLQRVEIEPAGSVGGLDRLDSVVYVHRLIDYADLEPEGDLELLRGQQSDVRRASAAEAAGRDLDVIDARLQVRNAVEAVLIGVDHGCLSGRFLNDGDFGGRNAETGTVGDASRKGRTKVLRQ